ncbi:MAG: GntR family transcriptional regulator [Lachnospiraceae bacterium]|nr:GntR family transcriptional regulator [Lachnospiraceae bacterium]
MIVLDLKGNTPIYEQIIEQMKFHVMKGNLKPGNAIPSVRKLALELKITPGTVAKAYQELERQEIIETIRGKGTFIAREIRAEENQARLTAIKKQLNTIVMELRMMGYDSRMVVELVKGIYEEMSVC